MVIYLYVVKENTHAYFSVLVYKVSWCLIIYIHLWQKNKNKINESISFLAQLGTNLIQINLIWYGCNLRLYFSIVVCISISHQNTRIFNIGVVMHDAWGYKPITGRVIVWYWTKLVQIGSHLYMWHNLTHQCILLTTTLSVIVKRLYFTTICLL